MKPAYDEVIDKAFLVRASPETAYSWLRESHIPYASRSVFYDGIPERIEAALANRHDEVIDLGLAQWATQPETLDALFARHCIPPNARWPLEPDTFSYAILSAILSNASVRLPLLEDHQGHLGIPKTAFEWIVENGDDNLTYRMHSNDCVGLDLICKCCRREGVYERISDDRWLKMLTSLSASERFKRPAREFEDSPDMFHWDLHQPIADAVRICPKTVRGSNVLWNVFNNISVKAASDAYISDADLKSAVDAWDVEIADDGSFSHWKYDSLTPGERVQFNLLRLYCSPVKLDPNDERRPYRLAAYSKCYLSGKNQMKVEDFQKYSDRDGPAFVYAASFNGNIWSDDEASMMMVTRNFPAPENTELLRYNTPSNRSEFKEEKNVHRTAETNQAETDILALRTEIANLSAKVAEEVGKAKSWMMWIAIAAVVIVKW
ncbi:MAG TPA: hypothetical protein VJ654_13215 [Noviherbaspirillum sp.]|nr:hypothetical protein [Noviherbaspirillum sp.]